PGEDLRELLGGDQPALDEDLAEATRVRLLGFERLVEGLGRQHAHLDEELTEGSCSQHGTADVRTNRGPAHRADAWATRARARRMSVSSGQLTMGPSPSGSGARSRGEGGVAGKGAKIVT